MRIRFPWEPPSPLAKKVPGQDTESTSQQILKMIMELIKMIFGGKQTYDTNGLFGTGVPMYGMSSDLGGMLGMDATGGGMGLQLDELLSGSAGINLY